MTNKSLDFFSANLPEASGRLAAPSKYRYPFRPLEVADELILVFQEIDVSSLNLSMAAAFFYLGNNKS